ncbi:MAG: histidine phosphatase family protein [Mangrovicoccus sp.]|nr:histidine phosphatase family protein [Mangrovicoccus sp.]
MSTLWLIRHGPTHRSGMHGWNDIPADLSDHAALARLAAALPEDLPVISSDLIRARATADAIQGNRARLGDDPSLREMHFGDWEGKEFDEVWETTPELSKKLWDEPGETAPPGGESWNALRARVDAGLDALMAAHPGGLIAVAHFGVILTQVQRATGESSKEVFRRKVRNLSLTEIRFQPMLEMPRFDHIP